MTKYTVWYRNTNGEWRWIVVLAATPESALNKARTAAIELGASNVPSAQDFKGEIRA